MNAKAQSQEDLAADLRQFRGELARVVQRLDRLTEDRPSALVRWLRRLDRAFFSPPHTFQSVLTLVQARLKAAEGRPTPEAPREQQ